MATVYRTSLIAAVAILKPVDLSVSGLFFPLGTDSYFTTPEVEFDVVTQNGTSADYNSFSKEANVVKKDGFDTIKLNPLNINESTNITAENSKNRGAGEPQYGGASTVATSNGSLQRELDGFGLLRGRGDRAVKKAMYEALMTGKIVYGQDGIKEIDFNMPAGNKTVLTGTDIWTDAGANPVASLISVYDGADISPESVVLSETAYAAFIAHATTLTTDNTSTGKKRNFQPADLSTVPSGAKFFKAGRLADRPLDVYVEQDTYKNSAGTKVKYLSDGFAVFGNADAGQMLFGGIPMLNGENINWVSASMMLKVDTKENPTKVDRIYQSAPLPTLKDASAFYSMKVI